MSIQNESLKQGTAAGLLIFVAGLGVVPIMHSQGQWSFVRTNTNPYYYDSARYADRTGIFEPAPERSLHYEKTEELSLQINDVGEKRLYPLRDYNEIDEG